MEEKYGRLLTLFPWAITDPVISFDLISHWLLIETSGEVWILKFQSIPTVSKGSASKFRHNSRFEMLRREQSHSEWFDGKWFIVEKLNQSDYFIVVVIRTRGHHV